jgi:hypothetical protein
MFLRGRRLRVGALSLFVPRELVSRAHTADDAAAVDGEQRGGDEFGGVGGQECGGVRDVLGLADVAERFKGSDYYSRLASPRSPPISGGGGEHSA